MPEKEFSEALQGLDWDKTFGKLGPETVFHKLNETDFHYMVCLKECGEDEIFEAVGKMA